MTFKSFKDMLHDGWSACFRCGGKKYVLMPDKRHETCSTCNGIGLLNPNDIQKFTYLQESSGLETNNYMTDAKIEEIAQNEIAKKKGRPSKNKLIGFQ